MFRRIITAVSLSALGAAGLVAVAAGPVAAAPVTVTFTYTGAAQTWVVPEGVTAVTVDAYGAQGGRGYGENLYSGVSAESDPGAFGGTASATLPATPGETLQVNVGGRGTNGSTSAFRASLGGFNGGGNGGYVSLSGAALVAGGGGGGSSDVRQGTFTAGERVVVGAGGGGSGGGMTAVKFSTLEGAPVVSGGPGGDGGGPSGESSAPPDYAAGGGRPDAGGAKGATYVAIAPSSDATDGGLLFGGSGGRSVDDFFGYRWASVGGGGGGGLWGGGGGGTNAFDGSAGGGGGSSFGDTTTPGVRAGNGLVVISYESRAAPGVPTNVSATPGDQRATVAFDPPASDGGSPITSYTATCDTQSTTGVSSPLVVTGLANGVPVPCTVTATNAFGTGAASAPVTVTPALPQIIPGGISIAEGNGSSQVAWVPVTLSAPSAAAVTVAWATENYQAVAPADYAADGGTLRFSPGQTQASVPLTVKGDGLDEADEAFRVKFSNPANATVGGFGGLGAVTILDDDPLPVITPKGVAVTEGNSGTKVVKLPVSLSAPSGRTVRASWQTRDDSAVAPSDYVAASGTLSFAPGQTEKTVSVTVKGDTVKEAKERFFVALSNPTNATIGGIYGLGVVTITNDD